MVKSLDGFWDIRLGFLRCSCYCKVGIFLDECMIFSPNLSY